MTCNRGGACVTPGGMTATVKDFDWSQRLVLASDKLSCLHKPVLLLKLDLVDTDGVEKEPVILEFSESELDSFVQALGNAHQVLKKIIT